MTKVFAAVFVAVATATAGQPGTPKPTVEIRSEYLMTLEIPVEPAQSFGARRVVNTPNGGRAYGPRIDGTIVAPSGDWITLMPDGSSRLDVRLTIQTDDEELILVEYGGITVLPKAALDRLAEGESLTHEDAYIMIAPRFMTSSTKYAWLNHVQAIGTMVSLERGKSITYDIFAMR